MQTACQCDEAECYNCNMEGIDIQSAEAHDASIETEWRDSPNDDSGAEMIGTP